MINISDMKILIVEDEEIQRISLQDDLTDAGYETIAVDSPQLALELAGREQFDVILSDLKMPGIDGITLLQRVKAIQPEVTVIMMTAYGTVESAVQAMKSGAYDYLAKPFSTDELLLLLKRVENYQCVLAENLRLRRQLETRYAFGNIVGKSLAMQHVYQQLEIAASTNAIVLIEGETGTGKELAANAIHYNSNRKDGPFVKVSCAILSKEILESELLGHERGAFTGAIRQKKGRFELAHQGTIFLDDVDDIPLALQVKLLRVLEEQAFERVGGMATVSVDVRLIAATKTHLYDLVAQGKFREDLLYRLYVFPIKLPPLRARKEDISLLFEHFLRNYCAETMPTVDPSAMAILMDYPWPGNVRELKNVVERLSLSCQRNLIVPECLPVEIRHQGAGVRSTPEQLNGMTTLEQSVAQYETNLIYEALSKCRGNKAKAAELLRVPTSTLKSKIKKYGIG